ncbi:MAG: dihydroorotate dehydrogenase electron transfer subunit, partial [Acutalibacteraceae bacterium]
MKQEIFSIVSNKQIAEKTFETVLRGNTEGIRAGQFVNIKLDGFFLRRPISVCNLEEDRLTLIYKTVGKGTEKMSALEKGETLDLLTGLGNGYDTSKSGERPLLV